MTFTRPMLAAATLLATLVVSGTAVRADVFRPAYLELTQRDAETFDVLWRVWAVGDARLAIRVRFPEQTSNVTEPRGRFTDGAFTERWTIRRPGGLTGAEVRIDGLSASNTDVIARVVRLDGGTQVARLMAAHPHFLVEGPQSTIGVSRTYTTLGVWHILRGMDHLLFVLALVLVVGRVRRLLITVTAFTVAHSLTLAAATLGLVHVPQAPVEAVIALSIVFVASEIVHGLQGRPGLTARAPWVVAFAFGLLHGLGFAGALAEIGLPTGAIPLALFCFNVGVELGQLVFVAGVWGALSALGRAPIVWPRWARSVPAYAIGAVAMFWMIERVLAFR